MQETTACIPVVVPVFLQVGNASTTQRSISLLSLSRRLQGYQPKSKKGRKHQKIILSNGYSL